MSEDVNIEELAGKRWQTFFKKLKTFDSIPVNEWKENQILGYICHRFEQHYGTKYAFSFKTVPSKCPELYFVKQTMAMLNTIDKQIVKDYIDWVFENKLIPSKIHIRSLGYLTTPGFGNEFNFLRTKKEKISSSTELPTKYQLLASELNIPVSTYGELAFMKMAAKNGARSYEQYNILLDKLEQFGFNTNVLNNLS